MSPAGTFSVNIADGHNVNAPVYTPGPSSLVFSASPVLGGFTLRDALSGNYLLYLPYLGAFVGVPTSSGTLSNSDGSFTLTWETPTLFVAVPSGSGYNLVFTFQGATIPAYLGWSLVSSTSVLGLGINPVVWTLSTCTAPTPSSCTALSPSTASVSPKREFFAYRYLN